MSSSSIDALPDDVDALRELVIAQRAEHESQIAEQAEQITEQEQQIEQLHEWVRLLRHQKFGRRSEKLPSEHPGLFNEAEKTLDAEADTETEAAEEDDSVEIPAHRRRKRGRRPLPEFLPRVEVLRDLPEGEKVCAEHQTPLVELGRDVCEQLEIIPAQVYVVREIRPKYVCPDCDAAGVKSMPATPRLIPKGIASPSLLAHVAVSKYVDALPLYRQERMLERAGVDLGRATLANWMVSFGTKVQPLIDAMREELLAYDLLQMDETTFPVLKEPGKAPSSDGYLWVQRGGERDHPLLLYEYDRSRSGAVAKRLLESFKGYLQTDGYIGYDAIGSRDEIVHVGCFAHARRKFYEAVKGGGQQKASKRSSRLSKARQGLEFIRKLYQIERRVEDATPEERYRVRQEQAKPQLEKLRSWLDETLGTVPPKSLTGQALTYLNGQWPKLVRYADDGRIRIDTNLVENAIRPFVVGRKNWLFSDTVRGARASANLFSLIETAKVNGLEPFAYLRYLADRLPTAEFVRPLLPHHLAPTDLQIPDPPRPEPPRND